MQCQLCLGVMPGQATTSPPKGFPKRAPRNRETAWPGELKDTVFLTWVCVICSVKTLRPEPRKIEVFAALGYNLHLELASRCTFSCVWASYLAKPRRRPQKASQNARPETGKQHGLAGSTDPFFNHISPSPGGKTSRLNPLKNYTVLVRLWGFPCKTH